MYIRRRIRPNLCIIIDCSARAVEDAGPYGIILRFLQKKAIFLFCYSPFFVDAC